MCPTFLISQLKYAPYVYIVLEIDPLITFLKKYHSYLHVYHVLCYSRSAGQRVRCDSL